MAQETTVIKCKPSLYNIVLVGEGGVGKTCLTQRYVVPSRKAIKEQLQLTSGEYTYCHKKTRDLKKDGSFSEIYKLTPGLDFQEKEVSLPNSLEVKLQIWDTGGQERLDKKRSDIIRSNAAVICVVYDVTNLSSFQNLQDHINTLVDFPDVIKFVVGTKIEMDTERQVTFDEGKKFTDEMGCEFSEVSAANELNVDDVFMSVIKAIYRKKNPGSVIGWSCSAKTFFTK